MAKSILKSKKAKSKQAKSKAKNSIEPKPSRTIADFERVESGIEGLDILLRGGFLKGGTYLILGAPGTGKTIFANQLCFHQIQKAGRAVYVTLLAESHTRMFGNLKPMSFFEESRVSTEIQYMSGYSVLEREGLDGLLRLLRDLVYKHGANILFIDGVASADELSGSTVQFKKFVHHLNSVLGITGCTTFLLSSAEGDQTQPEYTMVDGIVRLGLSNQGMKTARKIEIRKFRGSSHIYGEHFFDITEKGIQVYPRIESLFGQERRPAVNIEKRRSTGVAEMDKMLGGGLTNASVTALLGPAGAGKTQLGMQFLMVGAEKGEQSLLLSMYEHPDRLEAKLANMGRSVSALIKKGSLAVYRRESGNHLIDKTLSEFLKEVVQRKTQRVFIDGIDGFRMNMFKAERLPEILISFMHELRALGVTVMFTDETDITRRNFEGAISNHSGLTDNIIEFRHADLEGERIPILTTLKTRESAHETTIRKIELTENGFELGQRLEFAVPYLPSVRVKGKSSR